MDGGQALNSAAAAAGKVVLKGVNHQKKVFSPTYKVLKSQVDKETTKTLKRLSKGKNASVKESKLYWIMCSGDQLTENLFAHVKNHMRRLGSCGRTVVKNSATKSVQALSAAFLLRTPGLTAVLRAVKLFREDCSSGLLKVSPQKAFVDLNWLKK